MSMASELVCCEVLIHYFVLGEPHTEPGSIDKQDLVSSKMKSVLPKTLEVNPNSFVCREATRISQN